MVAGCGCVYYAWRWRRLMEVDILVLYVVCFWSFCYFYFVLITHLYVLFFQTSYLLPYYPADIILNLGLDQPIGPPPRVYTWTSSIVPM